MKTKIPRTALAAAVAAAQGAGRIMLINLSRPKAVHSSEAHDIKLELDLQCQEIIRKRLIQNFPSFPLLGEEGINGDVTADYRWVVDPIDGTVNYFYGMPHAAVSIALQYQEQSIVGVVYDPFTNEMWTATRGTRTKLNGRPVQVSRRSKLQDAMIAMGFSKDKENLKQSLPHLNRLVRRVKKLRILGSAALELAYVSCGRLDAYVERRINLWDIAAGGLLVESAGGSFFARPVPGEYRYTLCADNGLLRRKLHISSLLR